MAEGSGIEDLNSADSGENGFDDVEMALTGINMMLNNGFDEASALFEKYRDESPLMQAGYSFVFFMQALMSFEEDKLSAAQKVLQETEKACDTSDGFVKFFKRKFTKKKKPLDDMSIAERIQRQVIVADSLLYQAILTFTNQDIPSYIKGGWFLRRAWKIYEKLHREVTSLQEKASLKKIDGFVGSSVDGSPIKATIAAISDSPQSDEVDQTAETSNPAGTSGKLKREPVELQTHPTETSIGGAPGDLSEDVLGRLLGSVNFGYGAFQLCMSMVPPKILKLIEFLGFEGDREVGLTCLDYTSRSRDMKAPLATLSLLWYHTVLRPFFALDGANHFNAGTQEAEAIIREKESAFPNSSLFLFFRGRIHRLRKENDKAYEMYVRAQQEAKGQREIELMCLYEISWYNLMKLCWDKSLEGFTRLRKESKWSKCYYTYLIAVCLGAEGKVKEAHEIFQQVPALVKRKNNQIEVFSARRAERYLKVEPTLEHCRLLTLELIFLWHALPTCSKDDLRSLLQVCEMQADPNVFHLKCLLEGALYKELGDDEMAIQCLRESLARHQGRKDDGHVAAFALFELASIYMTKPETISLAREELLLIKNNYKDYDFENRLSVRVNNALKKLKHGLQ